MCMYDVFISLFLAFFMHSFVLPFESCRKLSISVERWIVGWQMGRWIACCHTIPQSPIIKLLEDYLGKVPKADM